jgi:pimeloyl-ACP methyl ester carboxylesterase
MWDETIKALLPENRYRLVSLDWRGFGESEADTGVSTMEALADDVAGLMDALGMQNAVLCGLSMGGYVAFAFLRKYPQRVRGLVLANTKPEPDDAEGKANREKVATLVEAQGVDPIADIQVPKLLSVATRQHHPEIEARVRQMIHAATPEGIAGASRGMAQRLDSTDLLPHIHCPVLVITGEQDSLMTPQKVQAYAARIPDAQFVVIPEAGHLSNLEQPARFDQALRSFLPKTL